MHRRRFLHSFALAVCVALLTSCGTTPKNAARTVTLLNVSYDPTREFYTDYNQAFVKHWQEKAHQTVRIQQSHGGSGKQARSVIDGLEADVVTLGLPYDINAIQKAGDIAPGWEKRLPNNSAPYTSTVVLLVRRGNPKQIHDWSDLAKPGIQVITSNPKTSSGGRWGFLAAYGYALKTMGEAGARSYIQKVYQNVPVLDSGARGSTTTFVERNIGDVLIAWENEAQLAVNQLGKGKFEIVNPSQSILAEPPVALVDKVADKHLTRALATEYLTYLYSPEGQEIAARHYYRPRSPEVAKKYAGQFPKIPLFTISLFGGWDTAQKSLFDTGGLFDQIYKK